MAMNIQELAKTNIVKISQKEIDDFNAKYENCSCDPHFTKLHFAAKINSKEIGELLISKGADINAKDDIIYLNIKIYFLINIIDNK